MNEREIFESALEFSNLAERTAFLERVCGDDLTLRERVEALIRSHEEAGSFLENSAATGGSPTTDEPNIEKVGSEVGPYKLLQQIGEGGMGLVFMAEQVRPVRRRVALKIIKPGMDSRQVIARFEAERQALAIMDHPNIAKVLDAGTTSGGRPYFVMELVNGIPITEFADNQHLTAQERLQLFLPVFDAIQHAHQKGIIHRDLKPSNILTALYDGRPVPKVIDFGIAKAIDQRLTEQTLFTALGQIVGTVEYMSPEQATRNQLDVDTRSDIYSLGVVLYELLTGETPLDKKRLRSAAWDEIVRIIRDEEPPAPSARLSSSDRLPAIAANRRTEPAKLSALVRGELDWIVSKALEKDRSRRYESANQFADDVRRYLAGEAVLAGPPSSLYRYRKLIRRNWRSISVGLLLLASLLIGLAGTAWQAKRARQSEAKIRSSLQSERQARSNENTARQRAERSQQEAQNALQSAERRLAQVYTERGLAQIDIAPHTGLPWLAEATNSERNDLSALSMKRLRMHLLLRDLPRLTGFWPQASNAQFSKDGTKLGLTLGNELLVVELPDLTTRKFLHEQPVENFTFTDLGDRVATVVGGKQTPSLCRIWNTATGYAETGVVDLTCREFPLRDIPTIHFTPDGQRFVVIQAGMYNRWHTKMTTRVFDSHSMQQVGKTFAHHSDLDYIHGYHQLSPDRTRVLVQRGTTADDPRVSWSDPQSFPEEMNRVQQYDLITGQPIHPPLDVELDFYTNVQYNTDGTLIATADNGFVKLWNANDGTVQREFALSPGVTRASVWFHPDGTSLVIVEKLKASWLNLATGELKREWAHEDKFFIDPAGKHVVYRSSNGIDYLGDLSTNESTREKPLPDLYRVRFSPDGSRFVLDPPTREIGGMTDSLPERIYSSEDGQPLTPPWRFQEHFSPNGRFVLSQEQEGVWLWDLQRFDRAVERFPATQDVAVVDVAVSRDRSRFVSLAVDGTVSGWLADTGQRLFDPLHIPDLSLGGETSRWTSVCINSDATMLAVIGSLRAPRPSDQYRDVPVVQLWNLTTRTAPFKPIVYDQDEQSNIYNDVRFLNNSTILLVPLSVNRRREREAGKLAEDDYVRLNYIDVATGDVHKSHDLRGIVSILDITPDEQKALVSIESSVSNDPSFTPYTQLVSLESGQPTTARIVPDRGYAHNARLTPDAKQVLVGNGEVWDAASGKRVGSPLVTHRMVNEVLVSNDGQTMATVSNYDEGWRDRITEIRRFSLDGRPLGSPIINKHTDTGLCALSPDLTLIAVVGRKLRLWDAVHSLPLSAAMDLYPAHPSGGNQSPHQLFFSRSGDRLFFHIDQDVFVVDLQRLLATLPRDEQLAAWSIILAGQRIDGTGGVIPVAPIEYANAWKLIDDSRKPNGKEASD